MIKVKQLLFIISFICLFMVFPHYTFGGIVFEDGFDSYSWTSTYAYGTTVTGKSTAPFNLTADFSKAGWVAYRQANTANTLGDPTWAVTTEASHSGGKSLKYEIENTTSLWNGGGLTNYLGGSDNSVSGYTELYISLWMRFENGYVIPTVVNGYGMKLFRIYFGVNADLETNTLGDNIDYNNNYKLRTIVQMKGNGYMYMKVYRYPDTHVPNGQPYTDVESASSSNLSNLTQWQRVMYHIKLNTAGNNDGALELYLGDTIVSSINNVQLVDNTEDINSNKINVITLPDNYYNLAYGMTPNSEVGFYIDDFVISTTYVPLNYTVGSGSLPDSMPPAPPFLNN